MASFPTSAGPAVAGLPTAQIRATADEIAALFEAASIDLDNLTPFEEQVLMLWNRLELQLERSRVSAPATAGAL